MNKNDANSRVGNRAGSESLHGIGFQDFDEHKLGQPSNSAKLHKAAVLCLGIVHGFD